MTRRYSVLISGYKDTAIQTLEECLDLESGDEVEFEVVFLDNTVDSRHRGAAMRLFREAGGRCARTVYVPNSVPGKAATQNKGILQASGQYLVFLDDDVLPEENLLLEYDRAFERHPKVSAIQGRVQLQFDEPAAVPHWLNERFRLDLAEMDFGREILPFEMGLTGANMAFRAEIFTKYGRFDERLGPGRSGTLEDQEFSERIRAKGEVQLFWPHASVRHRIPPERLTVRRLAGIYYDVGFSDYFLSAHLVKGGAVRFLFYTLRRCVGCVARMKWAALRGRKADAILQYCGLWKHVGYYRQFLKSGKRGL